MSEIPKDVWLYKIVCHLNCDDISALCRTYGWFRRFYTSKERLRFLVDVPKSKQERHAWHMRELQRILVGNSTSASITLQTRGICQFCTGKSHPLTLGGCPFTTMELIQKQAIISISRTTASTIEHKNFCKCKRCNTRDMCWKLVPWLVFIKLPMEKSHFTCVECGEGVAQIGRGHFEAGLQGCEQCQQYYCYKCIDVRCVGCKEAISPKMKSSHVCAEQSSRWTVYFHSLYPATEYHVSWLKSHEFAVIMEQNTCCVGYLNIHPDELFLLLTRVMDDDDISEDLHCPDGGVPVYDIFGKESGEEIFPIVTLCPRGDGNGLNFKLL